MTDALAKARQLADDLGIEANQASGDYSDLSHDRLAQFAYEITEVLGDD